MRRAGVVAGVVLSGVMAAAASAQAEGRPIKRLPSDLMHGSLLWTDIPKQMIEVGKDGGLAAAVTWGPVKGAAVMVESATKGVWRIMTSDHTATRDSSRKNPYGPIVRYEF